MRKFVVLTAYNRPHYLRETLTALREAGPHRHGFDVFVSVDPSDKLGEIADVLEEFDQTVQHVEMNRKRKGDLNARDALEKTFSEFGAEVALYCQDDVVVSRDVFYLVNWWANLLTRDEYLCLWTHSYESDPKKMYSVKEDRGDMALKVRKDCARFHGEAFALSANNFERYFAHNWIPRKRALMSPNATCQGELSFLLEDNPDLFALVPCLSRSTHIGRNGGGCRGSFHDRVYANHPMSQRTYVADFTLLDAEGNKKPFYRAVMNR